MIIDLNSGIGVGFILFALVMIKVSIYFQRNAHEHYGYAEACILCYVVAALSVILGILQFIVPATPC